MLRTLLFMPGNNPGMLINADLLGADMVCFDLEDAVALNEKDSARILVRNALRQIKFTKSKISVRINPTDYPDWKKDLDFILTEKIDAIVIPKASVESVKELEGYIEEKLEKKNIPDTYLLIESAMSIMTIMDILKSSKYAKGVILGGEDYSSDMQVRRSPKSKELEFARFTLATAAKAFGVDAIDTPYTDVDNIEGLIEDTEFSKSIGLNGRLIISPRHVHPVHKVLSPKIDELEEAREILRLTKKAEEEGRGVFSFKGKMVDLPVIKRAQRTYENGLMWGLIDEE